MAINTAYKSNLLSDVNLVVHAILILRSGNAASSINYNITLSRFQGTREMNQVFEFLNTPDTLRKWNPGTNKIVPQLSETITRKPLHKKEYT
jgi:hypothetical protein